MFQLKHSCTCAENTRRKITNRKLVKPRSQGIKIDDRTCQMN